jgi:hypothetical protein
MDVSLNIRFSHPLQLSIPAGSESAQIRAIRRISSPEKGNLYDRYLTLAVQPVAIRSLHFDYNLGYHGPDFPCRLHPRGRDFAIRLVLLVPMAWTLTNIGHQAIKDLKLVGRAVTVLELENEAEGRETRA